MNGADYPPLSYAPLATYTQKPYFLLFSFELGILHVEYFHFWKFKHDSTGLMIVMDRNPIIDEQI